MAADEQLNEVLRVPLKQLQLVVAGQVTELPVMQKNKSLGVISIELRNNGSLGSRSRGLFPHVWVMLVKHQLSTVCRKRTNFTQSTNFTNIDGTLVPETQD